MNRIRHLLLTGMIPFLAALPVAAATFTVAKNGSGSFTTIQAAVDKAGPGDIVLVLDAATYPEQVTIDSAKNGMILTSKDPAAASKPRIVWQDKANVGPKTAAEAKIPEKITYDRNGALRVLQAQGVVIDGIAIDGGGVYPFGANGVWNGFPLQHGNAALVLWRSGDIIVRNCDIGNAYFGISVNDRNDGGVFANALPYDIQPLNVMPLSGYGRVGNHLVERNRIHNNSFGFFFENMWDLGSTIRYNLIYENHHATDSLATLVKSLTLEGKNQEGGAMLFKDHLLSPLAIYNNTFWHCHSFFFGNWRAGVQHLIFNNIYAKPHRYLTQDPVYSNCAFEMSHKFLNRMHNCVYACQKQAPSQFYVAITNFLQPAGAGIQQEGALVNPFPVSAEIRWVETKFRSEDPASVNFLVPDWSDSLVQKYIKDHGWAESGVLDPDGTPADLGAIPEGGGTPVDIVTIKPIIPVQITGTTALLKFDVTQRVGSMKNPVVKYMRYIRNVVFQDVFGNTATPIASANIIPITPAPAVTVGPNGINATIPAADAGMRYAFFELIIEGTGSDGKPFTTAVGFPPYRKLDEYKLAVEIWNLAKTQQLTQVTAGDTVMVVIKAFKADGQPFTLPVKPVTVQLQSGFTLWTPGNPPAQFAVPDGVTVSESKPAIFNRIPSGGIEYVTVAGKWVDGAKEVPFLGISNGIRVLSGPAERVVFQNPPSNTFQANPPKIDPGVAFNGLLYVYDTYGNKVNEPAQVALKSLSPSVGDIKIGSTVGPATIATDSTGSGMFGVWVTNGKENQLFTVTAALSGKNIDSANLIIGKPTGIIPVPSSAAAVDSKKEVNVTWYDLRGRVLHRETIVTATIPRSVRDLTSRWKTGRAAMVCLVRLEIRDKVSGKADRRLFKAAVY